MSETVIFHDMPGNISLENGVARIDLYDRQVMRQGQEGEPPYVFSRRLVLPLPALLELHSMLSQVVDRLTEEGVLQSGPSSAE